jgi:hypothetical protein
MCILSMVALAAAAHAHPVAPATAHDSGYEPDSCGPHGAIYDTGGFCTFSQCSCVYLPPGSTTWLPCPGKAAASVAPVGTYVYHRLSTCGEGMGPILDDPPFAPESGQMSCGHVQVTTTQTDPITNTLHIIDETNGTGANDWSHTCNPVADTGPAQTVCPDVSVSLNGTGSSDPNGDPLTYAWVQVGGTLVSLSDDDSAAPSFTAPAAQGPLAFRLTVKDPYGVRLGTNGDGISQASTTVTVEDDPPVVTTADVAVFWPLDQKLHAFSLDGCVTSISDVCDGALDPDAAGEITAVTSNEGGAGDAVVASNSTVLLRASRTGYGGDRTYTIDFLVHDSAGNAAPASCRVTLLHDNRPTVQP